MAAQVTDQDAGLTMAANFSAQFTTDAAPQVSGTMPINAATGVTAGSDITVTFSEQVNATTSSFTVDCSGAVSYTLSASPATTFTLNPDLDLGSVAPCTVTVIAGQITDVDSGDPPDTMAANHVFSFSTADAAPTVTSTTPANGAVGVASSTTITIDFSELVTINSAADFSVACAGMPQGYTVTTPPTLPSSASSVVITPAGNLPDGELCTVTAFGSSITDADAVDPPDAMASNYVFTFTTEAPPSVATTTPADTATGVAANASLTINFSESVNASAASFTVSCATSGSHTYALSSSPAASFTLDPDTDFAPNELCTVTVVAAQVTDADLVDPPNTMPFDVVFTFTTSP